MDVFSIEKPQNAFPVVFDSPHSGTHYPDDFDFSCQKEALQSIEDCYIDDLFSEAPRFGAPLLCAKVARSYIDLNRARDDIDLTLIEGDLPTAKPSHLSDSGIGLIPRLIKPGTTIYERKLDAEEVMNRIMTCYDPYHEMLENLIEDAYYRYGKVWHINCHSMPHKTSYPKNALSLLGGKVKAVDIALGDRDGSTCERDFVHALRDFWKLRGYHVGVNDPYKGVELIRKHAQPTRGKNSLQIEINRSLYMDENTGEKSKNYDAFKNEITDMIKFCVDFAQSRCNRIAAD
ncbi:MAG: N-formylglutamate amidohydrolase [Alphaproteobacteria bacterium]|nr:N-formylglutamate amidohydrolase [Alphaproteobacteria bacterium]